MTTRSLLIQALERPRVSEKEAGRISTFVEPPLQLIRSGCQALHALRQRHGEMLRERG